MEERFFKEGSPLILANFILFTSLDCLGIISYYCDTKAAAVQKHVIRANQVMNFLVHYLYWHRDMNGYLGHTVTRILEVALNLIHLTI